MEPYWSEANGHAPHSVKYESEAAVSSFPYCTESSLNFSTSATAFSEDDGEYATGRRNKTSRQDPLSHRIIEKRRRDRMNSCLADLSRLIPPQYQRKGRGRIEKTEIIEMAIRHLKHLQNECMQKENEYRVGYTDCMKEAAKFLCDSQMQEFCYRLLARLQEHCDEVVKADCYKTRSCMAAADNVSASSGSPHQLYHHPAQPLCQLRDILASDVEHSSDHNDVKDLSFRNHLNQLQRQQNATASGGGGGGSPRHGDNVASNSTSSSTITSNNNNINNIGGSGSGNNNNNNNNNNPTSSTPGTEEPAAGKNGDSPLSQQPHQAAVITSTAPSSLQHHTDSSNHHDHDFDSSREPMLHTDTSNMHSPPPPSSLLHVNLNGHHHGHHHHHHHSSHQHHTHQALHHLHQGSDSLMSASGRLRNFSESSHDIEHNNNYKYKNHIKERFNHEHEEETSSEHCPAAPLLQSEHSHSHAHSLSEHSKDGTEPEIAPIMAKKRKLAEAAAAAAAAAVAVDGGSTTTLDDVDDRPLPSTPRNTITGLLGRAHGIGGDEKSAFSAFGDIKTELNASGLLHSGKLQMSATPSSTTAAVAGPIPPPAHSRGSFAVPIFALHGQGTYYVPLNVDYQALLPFLNGIDLLEKNYTSMPVVHPININVNFMPATPSASLLAAAAAAAAVAAGKQQPPPVNGSLAGGLSTTVKAKLEALSNGW